MSDSWSTARKASSGRRCIPAERSCEAAGKPERILHDEILQLNHNPVQLSKKNLVYMRPLRPHGAPETLARCTLNRTHRNHRDLKQLRRILRRRRYWMIIATPRLRTARRLIILDQAPMRKEQRLDRHSQREL